MSDTSCRSCGARIFWAITAVNRSKMPVDVDPVADGTVVIVGEVNYIGDTLPVVTVAAADDTIAGLDRYKSHFATCPNADKHRRSR